MEEANDEGPVDTAEEEPKSNSELPKPLKLRNGLGVWILIIILIAAVSYFVYDKVTAPEVKPIVFEPEVIEEVAPQYSYVKFENEDEQVIDLKQLTPGEFNVNCTTLVCTGTTQGCVMKCDLAFAVQPEQPIQ